MAAGGHARVLDTIIDAACTRAYYPCTVMAPNTLGDRVAARREKLRLTQRQLAQHSGIDVVTVWRIENHYIEKPTWDTLAGLARVLDVTSDYLMHGARKTPSRARR